MRSEARFLKELNIKGSSILLASIQSFYFLGKVAMKVPSVGLFSFFNPLKSQVSRLIFPFLSHTYLANDQPLGLVLLISHM